MKTINLQKYSLAVWRDRCHWSQAEAAGALGISLRTYIRYEKTRVFPLAIVWAAMYLQERRLNQAPKGQPVEASSS